jgi:heme A synthase
MVIVIALVSMMVMLSTEYITRRLSMIICVGATGASIYAWSTNTLSMQIHPSVWIITILIIISLAPIIFYRIKNRL